ncbi:MAG: NgoMIV family type II restriction endonuclease [Synergistaceae bacterium]|nr:NgoMIV family type II restriction endonuclease [Synergistaceae bacterium]
MKDGFITEARREFHLRILSGIVRTNAKGTPNFADSSSVLSSSIAREMLSLFGGSAGEGLLTAQTAGLVFEDLCLSFLRDCFEKIAHLRPGKWMFARNLSIARFEQYKHLVDVENLTALHPELAAVLGGNYIIKPDIVVSREPEEDDMINMSGSVVDALSANRTVLRKANGTDPILHASVSCKWTLRSDRSQNSRTEALNLIRNRKGHLPHIVVVTAEPMPSRIASIALGTGDVDCVYHFALKELEQAIDTIGAEDSAELIDNMIRGNRLKDISDLPLDLAV